MPFFLAKEAQVGSIPIIRSNGFIDGKVTESDCKSDVFNEHLGSSPSKPTAASRHRSLITE